MGTTDPPIATDADGATNSADRRANVVDREAAGDDESPVDHDAIVARLDRVDDPELDRSIVELQYVERVDVDGREVTVEFVLPTAWCSPAFAWMMATGIRDEVGSLPDVSSVTVTLSDHMHGEEISTGVNEDTPFEAVFADAEDGVEVVRRKLDEKTRFARQYAAVRALEDAGLDPEQIATLRRTDVDLAFGPDAAAVSVRDGALTVTVARQPLDEYLDKAREVGLVTDDRDRLFTDREGDPLDADPESVEAVVRDSRLAAANVEGQATICASLHESRNGVTFD
jgi:metal-sulfur cluster biosynthetic enzyme